MYEKRKETDYINLTLEIIKKDRKYTQIKPDEFFNIYTGIVFILMVESVSTYTAFLCLHEILSNINMDELKVYVINNHDLSLNESFILDHFMSLGAGETLWIKNGKVIHTAFRLFNPEVRNKIVEYTKELLS